MIRAVFPFAIGGACASLALLARLALDRVAPGVVPYATFYPAALAATLLGGWLAGAVATVLGGLLAWWALVEPRWSFAALASGQAVSLALFFATAGLLVLIAERLRRQTARLTAEVETRGEAETRIARAAGELEAVLATVPAAVWFTRDAQVATVRRNAYAAALMRLPAEATGSLGGHAGERLEGVWIERDGQRLRPDLLPLQRALNGQASADEELDLVFSDGSRRTLLSNAQPLRDRSGAVSGAVSVSLDITERKRIEAALAESQSRLSRILDASPVAIMETDAEGRIVFANPSASRILRLERDAITARDYRSPAWGITRPDGSPIEAADLPAARALRGETVRGFEHAVVDPAAGRRIVLSVDCVPIGEPGRVTGVLTAFVDVTERFDVEAALREREARFRADLEAQVAARTAELEIANERLIAEIAERERAETQLRQAQKMEAIGQLTGGVAHDFNNLLAAISGALQLMERRLDRGETASLRRFLDQAAEGVRRAAELTRRLLAFSRQQPLKPQPLDANRLVAGMGELLRRTLGEAIAFETVLAGGLWTVSADANQLESALLNLGVNARDAMLDQARPKRLTIETANIDLDARYAAENPGARSGQHVMIAVSDTGAGMAPDVAAKAFDPFFTTKPVGQGTGLGLSQVYGFVRQSGGHVKIYSEKGCGTTVKIYLPRLIGQGEPPSPEAAALPEPSPASAPTDERLSVLVVEDEPAVRRTTVDFLGELGHRVLEADGARAALDILDREAVDVLFTDVVMPEMDGRRLADEAVKRRPGLIVLFTTGYSRNAVVHNGVLDAEVNLLPKPFSLDELGRRLQALRKRGGEP